MKLISWNVNGLRAIIKKDFLSWFEHANPDILCLQETKAHPDELPEEARNPEGYRAYFDHSKAKKGYSGVAIYSKIEPKKEEYGMGIPKFDEEGRQITLFFKNFAIINVYFPNGGMGPERLKFKLGYYDAFFEYIEKLQRSGQGIIFCGDVNTAHKEIDLARPKENENNTGFLPVERAWIDKIISAGYADSFRFFHPEKRDAYTYWDMKTFARDRNVGWRIDYFFVSQNLLPRLKSAKILSDVFGSDHCPIELEFR